jgi:hypothetical protein
MAVGVVVQKGIREHHLQRVTDKTRALVPTQSRGRRVHVPDGAARIENKHGIERFVKQSRPRALFMLALIGRGGFIRLRTPKSGLSCSM